MEAESYLAEHSRVICHASCYPPWYFSSGRYDWTGVCLTVQVETLAHRHQLDESAAETSCSDSGRLNGGRPSPLDWRQGPTFQRFNLLLDRLVQTRLYGYEA